MRIGVLYQDGIAGGYYRAVLPMREMERRGHAVLWPARPEFGAVFGDLPDCDAIHIHRHILPKDLELVVRLRERGIGVVWDIDDHISTYPKANRRAEPVRRRTCAKGSNDRRRSPAKPMS